MRHTAHVFNCYKKVSGRKRKNVEVGPRWVKERTAWMWNVKHLTILTCLSCPMFHYVSPLGLTRSFWQLHSFTRPPDTFRSTANDADFLCHDELFVRGDDLNHSTIHFTITIANEEKKRKMRKQGKNKRKKRGNCWEIAGQAQLCSRSGWPSQVRRVRRVQLLSDRLRPRIKLVSAACSTNDGFEMIGGLRILGGCPCVTQGWHPLPDK